jgi:hypothetical protein
VSQPSPALPPRKWSDPPRPTNAKGFAGKQVLHGTTNEELAIDAETGSAIEKPGVDGVVDLNVESTTE